MLLILFSFNCGLKSNTCCSRALQLMFVSVNQITILIALGSCGGGFVVFLFAPFHFST